MWGLPNTHAQRAVESFERQFEPDGDDFLYRRSQRGAAIRVSRAERDAFVDRYRRQLRRMTWLVAIGVMIAILIAAIPAVQGNGELNQPWTMAMIAVVIAAIIPLNRRIWNAPLQALAGRPTEGRDRDAGEARQIMLRQLSWGQLAAAAIVVPFALLHLSGEFDIWHGWGLLWPALASLAVVAVLVQAIRKWLAVAAD